MTNSQLQRLRLSPHRVQGRCLVSNRTAGMRTAAGQFSERRSRRRSKCGSILGDWRPVTLSQNCDGWRGLFFRCPFGHLSWGRTVLRCRWGIFVGLRLLRFGVGSRITTSPPRAFGTKPPLRRSGSSTSKGGGLRWRGPRSKCFLRLQLPLQFCDAIFIRQNYKHVFRLNMRSAVGDEGCVVTMD